MGFSSGLALAITVVMVMVMLRCWMGGFGEKCRFSCFVAQQSYVVVCWKGVTLISADESLSRPSLLWFYGTMLTSPDYSIGQSRTTEPWNEYHNK